jgi:dephospho-CoA kinase
MSLEIWMADYVIDNNGTLEDLQRNTRELMTTLLKIRS